jgi:hypothetical protein
MAVTALRAGTSRSNNTSSFGPFVVIPEMPKALSGIFADVAGGPRISASAFRGDNKGRMDQADWRNPRAIKRT